MHELNATKKLVENILAICTEKELKFISEVIVRVGTLTTYEAMPLQYYFSVLQQEHKALKGASLHVIVEQGAILCNTCKAENIMQDTYLMMCPECGSFDVQVTRGNDLIIQEIQIKGEEDVR